MPTFVDFVGLNTFVFEPISASNGVNTIGYPVGNSISNYENHNVVRINSGSFNPTASTNTDARKRREGTGALLAAINLKRTGPYGFCSWKQIRASDNPLTRYHNRNSDFTFVTTPGEEVNILSDIGKSKNVLKRFSNIHQYEEPVVSSKTTPIVWRVGVHYRDPVNDAVVPIRFSLLSSYANYMLAFSNDKVNDLLKINIDDEDLEYNKVRNFYVKGGLQFEDSPLTIWDFMKYKESVYPQARNQYRKEVRSRQRFANYYNDNRIHRRMKLETDYNETTANGTASFSSARTTDHRRRTFNMLGYRLGGTPAPGGPHQEDFNAIITQSYWPLDAAEDFTTRINLNRGYIPRWDGSTSNIKYHNTASSTDHLLSFAHHHSASGILQNNYSQLMEGIPEFLASSSSLSAGLRRARLAYLDLHSAPAPYYSRRHMIKATGSVSNPSGVDTGIHGRMNSGSFSDKGVKLFAGEALWEAADQAGKHPYPNSYEEWSDDIRKIGKNYSLIPEYRMSDHIQDLLTSGSTHMPSNIFSLTGATYSDSSEDQFYKTYSNTDFMKHFELINVEHKSFCDSKVLTLRCHAIKKFLPYEGFYPAERTLDLAAQFSASYFNYTRITSLPMIGDDVVQMELINDYKLGSNLYRRPLQNLLVPMFAPGIMYNTIKSGVAVDFPIYTSGTMDQGNIYQSPGSTEGNLFVNPYNATRQVAGDDYMIAQQFTSHGYRVPFEAIVEPESYLANKDIRCMEPHPSGNISSSVLWTGEGNSLYRMMANNFLAESVEFFLKDQNLSSIVSRKQSELVEVHPNKTYSMRIKMYRTMDGAREFATSANNVTYIPPQDLIKSASSAIHGIRNISETFTMYSRPTAFGPPSLGSDKYLLSGSDQYDGTGNNWNPGACIVTRVGADTYHTLDARTGFNYPYTPPYYHGQAWMDIHVKFEEGGQKTFAEIFEKINTPSTSSFNKIKQRRSYDVTHAETTKPSVAGTGLQCHFQDAINKNAVQLTSSLNVFGIGKIQSVDLLDDSDLQEVNLVVNTNQEDEKRWVIQTKFETPMLNFNHIRVENGNLTLPTYGSESVPRGMWHQYGRLPKDEDGVFMQVTDIPESWTLKDGKDPAATGSLANICGFTAEPVKLGKVANSKTISEAVVAIPFLESEGRKKFFKLERDEIRSYIAKTMEARKESRIGLSIKKQIERMEKYVFPPSFDFVNFEEIDPIAMYIFEFSHKLTQNDLSDIWQNLPPDDISVKCETATVVISHPLLEKELLGSGQPDNNKNIEIPDQLRWMVFKVKKRSASNYFKKVIAKEPSLGASDSATLNPGNVGPIGAENPIQYNWPYDFFSLVELVKIDSEIEFANADYTDFWEVLPTVSSQVAAAPAIALMNADPAIPWADQGFDEPEPIQEEVLVTTVQPTAGCTDPLANNTSQAAIDSGYPEHLGLPLCTYDVIEGCMDPDALNYNEGAFTDDGSCEFETHGCYNRETGEILPASVTQTLCAQYSANTQAQNAGFYDWLELETWVAPIPEPAEPVFACYNVLGVAVTHRQTQNTCTSWTQQENSGVDGEGMQWVVVGTQISGKLGCMDSSATNYDSTATVQGYGTNSCEYLTLPVSSGPVAMQTQSQTTTTNTSTEPTNAEIWSYAQGQYRYTCSNKNHGCCPNHPSGLLTRACMVNFLSARSTAIDAARLTLSQNGTYTDKINAELGWSNSAMSRWGDWNR